ncbi:MAG: Ig-like domain-containing protein, partial [Anaerolineales bacterium]|nr:Ig-like domain-containing protein [Anaerolineales bacterium]
NGLVTNNGDGSFTYAPNVGPFLADSFTYRVWDNDGAASNVATVTIRINKPDLAVIKEASTDSAAPGEVVQFFISIINNGPGTAFSVSVSDDLGDCFHWVGSPSFGSLGNLAQGDARVLVPMAQVDAAPDPQCDDTNRAEVTAANADTSSATVTVSIQTPPTMLMSMLMPVELTPLGSPTPTATVEPTITGESSLTPTTDPADPTPTVGAEVSQTSTAETPSETPLASVAPPTAEGTATGEPPIEPTAPTDPPTEAPPTPEPFVVPSEEATTPAPEPSEPPAPASEPPGPLPEAPMPEPPTEPPVVEEAPALPPGGGEEPPAAPAGGGEEGPAGPPGGGEEPPSESMAAVLSFVRWDRLSRRPVWGRPDGVYAAADSGWLIRYLFAVFAPPGSLPAPPTPTPLPRR